MRITLRRRPPALKLGQRMVLWRRRRWRHALGALVMLGGFSLGLVPPARGFRKDEVECEETAARLAKCCSPEVIDALNCRYSAGCGVVEPDLSVNESRCLRKLSCAQINADNICGRILSRSERGNNEAVERLCP